MLEGTEQVAGKRWLVRGGDRLETLKLWETCKLVNLETWAVYIHLNSQKSILCSVKSPGSCFTTVQWPEAQPTMRKHKKCQKWCRIPKVSAHISKAALTLVAPAAAAWLLSCIQLSTGLTQKSVVGKVVQELSCPDQTKIQNYTFCKYIIKDAQ